MPAAKFWNHSQVEREPPHRPMSSGQTNDEKQLFRKDEFGMEGTRILEKEKSTGKPSQMPRESIVSPTE